mmetsp:Transcript_18480/g.26220  ORF Transcript_18480/g.26220 Transcript_18480/m.26220 type:complete len:83 (-) Transcript_18480:173-421(-)
MMNEDFYFQVIHNNARYLATSAAFLRERHLHDFKNRTVSSGPIAVDVSYSLNSNRVDKNIVAISTSLTTAINLYKIITSRKL